MLTKSFISQSGFIISWGSHRPNWGCKMNAATAPGEQFTADNGGGRSDSDTDPEDSPEYYQPILAGEGGDDESEFSDEDGEVVHQLPNGYAPMEHELSSLDLSDDEDEDEGEEEEERLQETAIESAIREEERRRNAPLTAENAGRVREAMRGVQFGGPPPQWAGRVPEDEWIHQIRDRSRSALLSAAGFTPIHRNP